jgi:hypothetical protein
VMSLSGDDDVTELPVIRGEAWFDADGKPFVLRVEYPLTSEEMVAALYGVVDPTDIASDEDLCGSVAVTLSLEGLPGLSVRVQRIRRAERAGSIESAPFLATCRQRVTALTQQVP